MNRLLGFATCCSIMLVFVTAETPAQSTESLMNTGQELVQRGAFNQAVTAFRKALAREPDFFEAQFNLAFAYLQWQRYPEAVTEFKKALSMQPRNAEAWSNLAIAYDNLNRPNDATDALYHAVQIDPNNLNARMNLAAMYANANQNQKAIQHYKEVIKMDGSNGEAYLNLSKCLIATKNVKEAKEYLKQAMVNLPNKGDANAELGTIYWKTDNDIDKGIAEYRAALAKEPTNPAFYEDLALALESKGQKDEAIETWKNSLVYIDDALNKEKIQDRIDRLEKGMTGTSSGASGAGSAESGAKLKAQTADLERELRGDEQKSTRSIDAKPVNISKDFDAVSEDESSGWDLEKEAKKRAADKNKGKKSEKKKSK
ncbi:MAG: tetratricopeptide repeat protein [Chitinispirillaceae bacterium]|nr:tetratricopeptide repeat protein [Chitinispirillaceae bacterium]